MHEDGEVLGRGGEVGLQQQTVVDTHHVHLGPGIGQKLCDIGLVLISLQ